MDRALPDEDHLERTIGYVEQNPSKRNLSGFPSSGLGVLLALGSL
jgi:hypothetical protein